MHALTVALAVAAVVVYGLMWLSPEALDDAIRREMVPGGVSYVLTPPVAATAFVLGCFPIAAVVWGLWNAALLFRDYGAGRVLPAIVGRRLRHFGAALIALPATAFIVRVAGSLLLTMNNPPGQRHIILSADLGSLVLAVAGAILIAAGWGMVEAARIADENRRFV